MHSNGTQIYDLKPLIVGVNLSKIMIHFNITCRILSMVVLTNSRRGKEKPMIDYISTWRNLNLNYRKFFFFWWIVCYRDMRWRHALGTSIYSETIKAKHLKNLLLMHMKWSRASLQIEVKHPCNMKRKKDKIKNSREGKSSSAGGISKSLQQLWNDGKKMLLG